MRRFKAQFILCLLCLTLFFPGCHNFNPVECARWEMLGPFYIAGEDACFVTENHYINSLMSDNSTSLICNSNSCMHNREDCSAYFEASKIFPFVYSDRLMIITDYLANSNGELYLYSANPDGTGRKKEALINDNVQAIRNIIVDDGKIFIAYYNRNTKDMMPMEIPHAGVLCYDIATQKTEMVWEADGYSLNIVTMSYQNGLLAFNEASYDCDDYAEHIDDSEYLKEHHSYNMHIYSCYDDTFEMVDTVNDIEDIGYIPLYEECAFYNKDGSLYALNTGTGDSFIISTAMKSFQSFDSGFVYLYDYDSRSGEFTVYTYDRELHETDVTYGNKAIISAHGDRFLLWDFDTVDGSGELRYVEKEDL